MVIVVKRVISYLVMSLLFFNVLFIFYYYFKIVNFLYIDFLNFNNFVNIILTNLIILTFDIIYIIMYRISKLDKLSYFFVVLLGMIIGIIASFIVLKDKNYEVIDYLGVISYFIINTVFLSYSLYFDNVKEVVFK